MQSTKWIMPFVVLYVLFWVLFFAVIGQAHAGYLYDDTDTSSGGNWFPFEPSGMDEGGFSYSTTTSFTLATTTWYLYRAGNPSGYIYGVVWDETDTPVATSTNWIAKSTVSNTGYGGEQFIFDYDWTTTATYTIGLLSTQADADPNYIQTKYYQACGTAMVWRDIADTTTWCHTPSVIEYIEASAPATPPATTTATTTTSSSDEYLGVLTVYVVLLVHAMFFLILYMLTFK